MPTKKVTSEITFTVGFTEDWGSESATLTEADIKYALAVAFPSIAGANGEGVKVREEPPDVFVRLAQIRALAGGAT